MPRTASETYAGDRLSIELIRRRLDTETVGSQILLFWEVPSTNETLRRFAEAGGRQGAVVLAETQTAGRGRLGTTWFSPVGVNLYASALFRPDIAAREVGVFSLIASLALSDALRAEGAAAGIKWPNDIVIGGRKVAGTLVASASASGTVDYVILGVGVNLNVDDAALERALGDAAALATSVRRAVGRPIDRNAFTATFLNLLDHWFLVHRRRGPGALLAAWRDRDVLRGRSVSIAEDGARYQGRVVGMDGDGGLLVEEAPGICRQVTGGQVRVLSP